MYVPPTPTFYTFRVDEVGCFLQVTSHLKKHCPGEEEGGGRGKLYQPIADTSLFSPHTLSSSLTLKKMRALRNKLTNHEDYDSHIFTYGGWDSTQVGMGRSVGGVGKVRSAGKLNLSQSAEGKGRTRHASLSNSSKPVAFSIAHSPPANEK